jgi:hypothetical protein
MAGSAAGLTTAGVPDHCPWRHEVNASAHQLAAPAPAHVLAAAEEDDSKADRPAVG